MFLNKEIHVLPILYCSSRAFVYMTVPNFDCFVMLLIVSDMTVCCSHCIGDHWIALVIKAQNKLYLLAAVHIGLKKMSVYLPSQTYISIRIRVAPTSFRENWVIVLHVYYRAFPCQYECFIGAM